MGTKACSKCRIEKSLDQYTKDSKGRADGYQAKCKKCAALATAEWRKSRVNQDRVYLRYYYGISLEFYEERLRAQNYVCAICSDFPEGRNRRLCVDHDHVTGKFRGLLCDRCNKALGLLKDNPQKIATALVYLMTNGGTTQWT